MNKIDKKTIMLGVLALGVTVIPLTGAFIYRDMQNKSASQSEYAEKNTKEKEQEETTITKEEVKKEKQEQEANSETNSQEIQGEKQERASPEEGRAKMGKHKREGGKIDNKEIQST